MSRVAIILLICVCDRPRGVLWSGTVFVPAPQKKTWNGLVLDSRGKKIKNKIKLPSGDLHVLNKLCV